MPELRQNFFIKEWALIATGRASGARSWPLNPLSKDRRVNHITIFKNHGADAGASLHIRIYN